MTKKLAKVRENKGKAVNALPEDYVALDLETTGLDPEWDSIIEIGMVRVRRGEVVAEYSTLVNPGMPIDDFIAELTGITNDMLAAAPALPEVLPAAREFLGDDIILGHNINFDINFIYDNCECQGLKPVSNGYIDTMRISRRVLPDLKHHRLGDIVNALGVDHAQAHRAIGDCHATIGCYKALLAHIDAGAGREAYITEVSRHGAQRPDLHALTADGTAVDEMHPLYGKHCVFTGTLAKMVRLDAAQAVVNVGGLCDNGVTKDTNFLILGASDYSKIKDGKSNKLKRAESLIAKGADLQIISENVFYDLMNL
jgi:DNA polymerase-3 subunit epsilon|nr:MAG TPA: DNA polymerase III subunit alpha [Caudoviricetes sp.]